MRFIESLALVALGAVAVSADGLNARAKQGGRYMGTEYDGQQFSDSTFMSIANNLEEFGAHVPENSMKVCAEQVGRALARSARCC
jgi:hypothetical protein